MPPRVGSAGAGCDGAIGAGTGFGARFLAFALLAAVAFFIPFFLRAGAPPFAFLDFFATFTSRSIQQNCANTAPHPQPLIYKLCTPSLIATAFDTYDSNVRSVAGQAPASI
jgi:hypothetical protein